MILNTPEYTIELFDIHGNMVLDISPFVNPSIDLKLNDADVITFDIDLKQFTILCDSVNLLPRNVLYPAKTNVLIRRNGLVLTAGEVSNANTTKDEEGNTQLSVTVDGWINYFAKRFLLKTYTSVDRSLIAWDAIDTVQSVPNGDYGVVLGETVETYNSDLTADYKDVKSILQRYTYALPVTYDFDISTEIQADSIVKLFNTYLRKGSDKPQIELVDPINATFNNIRRSSDTLANKLIGLGSGIGEERLESVLSDTNSQLTYLVREKKQTWNSVIAADTLNDNTRGVLENSRSVLATFNAIPQPNTLDLNEIIVGDSLTCRVEQDSFNDDINGMFRIYGISVKVDENRQEDVTLNFYKPDVGGELDEANTEAPEE